MTRFMVHVYEAVPETNTRWKPLLKVELNDEDNPDHGGYSPTEWALLEAVHESDETVHPEGGPEAEHVPIPGIDVPDLPTPRDPNNPHPAGW